MLGCQTGLVSVRESRDTNRDLETVHECRLIKKPATRLTGLSRSIEFRILTLIPWFAKVTTRCRFPAHPDKESGLQTCSSERCSVFSFPVLWPSEE